MKKVLVIDDSKLARLELKKTLNALEFEVIEASDGLIGLEMIKEEPLPDLILLDWNMPNMNGLEFLLKIKKDTNYSKIPIIMSTVENEMPKILKVLEAGADEFVMKPFEKEELKNKLRIIGLLGWGNI